MVEMTGKIIGGKYQIVDKIGSGGSGEVYKAYHIHLKTPWALKVIPYENVFAENELAVLKRLNHPAFPRVVDVVTENDKCIVVFDYYEGPNMQEIIDRYGRVDEKRVLKWAIQILDALSYLHNCFPTPIIYRDLKPSNLIVLNDDTVKLIDFGAARQFNESKNDDTIYLGTPGYAAPEQYGSGQTDIRTDIYNFGMTLFHLLSGIHPLKCNEVQMKDLLEDAGVSKDLISVVLKCTAKNPDERFISVEEIKNAINLFSNKIHFMHPAHPAGKNAVEISVSGIQKGVGVTHFCILFGMWLKNRGYRTAILEYGENSDALCLCRLLNKESQLMKKGYYEVRGLDIYPSMGIDKIDGFRRSEYDFILLDYGIHDEYVSRLMPRSDVRLIVAPGADWKIRAVSSFVERYDVILKMPNTYLSFPMQDRKSISVIKSYFKKVNILALPYAVNPWKINPAISKEIENIYNRIFQVGNS
ncbi:serine/threonine-protein kinase Sps1 [Thermoclostridium stercorarium subsp. stercorarium DSM 8532]|uniref:non-specific serine/threonine protein kinase n=4 Tax=Thermoclostridium stercorarium TaxID=1510 RepID=L7VNK7_THES1|nr:serine/threonine-protein kinase Sps1 [Thermoclostridium stercorarium subsp. stercorarium DSM 8532]AGI39380.1 protein kinase [Thermoclostridium stercorarium subsp. stercorarium DSM 8532]ANW98698.1 serine/threonine protein kinase [Thermoclostridium stercorarium subsp. thermolacticum DSM 2910]ANX01239.1 serine/threonine protein kinase [Thermoclostridium stercorarium subsp. leptospartum DSM 9219]